MMDDTLQAKTVNGVRLLLQKVRGQLVAGEHGWAVVTLFGSVVPLVASLAEDSKIAMETMAALRTTADSPAPARRIEWLVLDEVDRLLANPDPMSLRAALQWLGCIVIPDWGTARAEPRPGYEFSLVGGPTTLTHSTAYTHTRTEGGA